MLPQKYYICKNLKTTCSVITKAATYLTFKLLFLQDKINVKWIKWPTNVENLLVSYKVEYFCSLKVQLTKVSSMEQMICTSPLSPLLTEWHQKYLMLSDFSITSILLLYIVIINYAGMRTSKQTSRISCMHYC